VAIAIANNALPPLITTMSTEFRRHVSDFGATVTVQFLGFAVAAYLAGVLSRRLSISPRRLLRVGMVAMTLLFPFGAFIGSFEWLFVWVALLGMSAGLVETFGSICVSKYDRGDSARLLHLSQVFFALGAVTAPELVSIVLDASLPWRSSFVFFALGSAAIAAILLFTTHGRPDARVAEDDADDQVPMQRRSRMFALAAGLAMFVYTFVEGSFLSWTAAYFELTFALSASEAASRLALFWLGLLVGRMTAFVMPPRLSLWPVLIVGSAGVGVCIALLAVAPTPTVALLATIMTGFFAGPIWPSIVSSTTKIGLNPQLTSTVIAVGAVGIVASPAIGARIIRHAGYGSLFGLLTLLSAVMLISVLLAYRFSRVKPTRNG